MTTKTLYCCAKCGGTEVYADAWASLNDPDEVMTFDATHCMDCDAECSVVEHQVHDDFADTIPVHYPAPE